MKTEMKENLWNVQIESWGNDDDYMSEYIVVSWNNYEEAKNAVKVYYQEKEVDIYKNWLIFSDWEKWQHSKKGCNTRTSIRFPFDINSWRGETITISRLEVISSWWEVARKSLHLLDNNL